MREGLDLPQVSLVAILNAGSVGFLRSETALLQTIGRAARNINGTAILYANKITDGMKRCIDDTNYRRQLQLAYNSKHRKEMRSTTGSSILSIFDILKDKIEAEKPLEVVTSTQNKGARSSRQLPVFNGQELGISEGIEIVTHHIPSKPGVYFWKDNQGIILYIGKAKKPGKGIFVARCKTQ